MATSIQLTQEVTEVIAGQLGTHVSPFGIRYEPDDSLELGESFQLWMLPGDAVISNAPLELATLTGKWYHLIYRNGKASFFAYSQPYGPRAIDWHLTAILESDAPLAVEAAIAVVDDAFDGEEYVRLVSIPIYTMQVFWIVSNNENLLVPAVIPEQFREAIVPFKVVTATDFFEQLRKLPHVQGIVVP